MTIPVCKIAQENGGRVPLDCLFKCERGCNHKVAPLSDRVLLCIDLSYQTYRAAAAHPNLSSRRRFTGGLYGFLQTLAKMTKETRATEVVFCRDVKPYLRSLEYPEYKQVRKKSMDPELKALYEETVGYLDDFFTAAGIATWGIQGFECDDLIAHVVHKYRGRYSAIYAGSNDSDLYQLFFARNFHVYSTSITKLMNFERLQRERFLTPEQHMITTALTGTHNDVAGIDGVGPVTAGEAVRNPAKMRALRALHADVIDRNLRLIKLPHRDFPWSASPVVRHQVNVRAAYRFLTGFDIDVTPGMENSLQVIAGNRR